MEDKRRKIYWRGWLREERKDNACTQKMDAAVWHSRHFWSRLFRIRVLAMVFAVFAAAVCQRFFLPINSA